MAFGFPPLPTPALNLDKHTLNQAWVRFWREMYKLRIGQGAFQDGGELIEGVALAPFVDNDISHTLGRAVKAWLIVRDQGVECNFEAYAGSTQSVAGAAEIVELDTEESDRGANFNTTTYTFTAPVAGLYQFWAATGVGSIATGKTSFSHLYKNGSNRYTGSSGGSNASRSAVSAELELAQSDTIALYVEHDDTVSRSTLAGLDDTRMEGRLIRETWDDQDNNSTPESTLVLRTTYAHTVSIWVI